MKTLKKLLLATFAVLALFGVSSMFASNANASSSKYHYYEATTKVPLKYYLLEPKNNKLVLPSKAFIEANKKDHTSAFKIIKAGTKIEIYSDPVIKSGKNKYYQVVFKSKKYKNLVQGVKGVFPAIEINNFNQLKNMHEVNES